ncbi:MAG: enoyl-CoA hydratase-related protein [Gallionellaceae bacterium]|nr:enoyl-CoA hydratase-related protein [Gallionellaceae bacterium]
MRILLITHAFNSLTQRLYVELVGLGHEVSVEFDINDGVTVEAVELFRPDLILAPYLRRAIPEAIWRCHPCLIVHPGVVGDRGPSALDRAILRGEPEWGVTVLQAEAEMDAGPVWASASFTMRPAAKSSLYRNEVTEATVRVVLAALARLPDYRAGRWQPVRPPLGPLLPLLTQAERAIDWARDDTATVLRKIAAADGFPGVADRLFGQDCHLFDARAFAATGQAGELLGRAGTGIVRATADGAVRIGHCKRRDGLAIKLPAVQAYPEAAGLPELAAADGAIRYREAGAVGILEFDFYNGAMATADCLALLAAYRAALERPTRVIVLAGGADFFSNGLDLNRIEAAESPADESWRNIEAMDDLCRAVIETGSHLTVAALRGNAGAGGAFLALAADRVWARDGIMLNPHYKNMGNLYGSEYWTYLLPRRLGAARAGAVMARRLPLGVAEAAASGFVDGHFGGDPAAFLDRVVAEAAGLADAADFAGHLAAKRARRAADEASRPLADYRADELAHMRRNFYGFDPSYHVARHHFVLKAPHSWTPRHLAAHRELGWQAPEESGIPA